VHLDRTSFHVDGRSNNDHVPDAQVVPITRGYRRDHRPDRNQVRLALSVEHQAGIPVLMKPLSGNSRDAPAFSQIVQAHIAPWHTTDGTTSLVADGALYREDNLSKLSGTCMQWITRVPATLSEAQAALAQTDPPTMAPLLDGYRDRVLTSTDGGVAQRWLLVFSEPRQSQAQRTVDTHLLKRSEQDVNAFTKLGRMAFACAVDAPQALSSLAHGLQATFVAQSTVRSAPRDGTRGRPGSGAPPDQVVYAIAGSLASRVAARQARIAQPSCFLLATNELDDTQLPPQKLREGDKGQGHAERGFRFLKDPRFLASSLYLKKPERIMALLMVMTVCLLVYAALEYRIRHALKDHGATFPHQKGTPYRIRQRGGSFTILWGFTCSLSPGSGLWY
jgi:transposase